MDTLSSMNKSLSKQVEECQQTHKPQIMELENQVEKQKTMYERQIKNIKDELQRMKEILK